MHIKKGDNVKVIAGKDKVRIAKKSGEEIKSNN